MEHSLLLNSKALITLCVGFAFWENASEITRNASKTRASNIPKRETQLALAILHLAFWSRFGRVLVAFWLALSRKRGQTPTKMADEESQKRIVAFLFLLQEGYFDVQQDEGPPKRKKRKIWVREWLRRRLDADTDTMFTLQRELLAVSLFIVMSSARVCWRVCGSKKCQFQ